MVLAGQNWRKRRKTYTSAILSTTNLTYTDLGSNPGLRSKILAGNQWFWPWYGRHATRIRLGSNTTVTDRAEIAPASARPVMKLQQEVCDLGNVWMIAGAICFLCFLNGAGRAQGPSGQPGCIVGVHSCRCVTCKDSIDTSLQRGRPAKCWDSLQ
jgi:hypothetical protein